MKDLDLNKITDEHIIEIFISPKTHFLKAARTSQKWLSMHPNILHYLLNRYYDSTDIVEIIYRIDKNINNKPTCPVCGNFVNFNRFTTGFFVFCSNACVNKSIETKNKIAQTKFEKYGDPYYHNIDKMKQTNMEKYNGPSPFSNINVQNKAKQSCIKKYGVDNILKSSIFRKQIQNTCIEKYGVIAPNTFGSQKFKENIFNKYGVENISQLDEIKEKVKNTCLNRYGVTTIFNTSICRKKAISKNAMDKKYITMQKNHTFNSSKVEQQFKEYLEQNYPNDFEYQYRSELYPFNCDFYIKSLDLYIEIQGNWTHSDHPFDENNENDLKRLEYMKSKNSKYYQNAIETWTIRDVNKRNMAKQNNLNYLEIFSKNINEVIKQFNDSLNCFIFQATYHKEFPNP